MSSNTYKDSEQLGTTWHKPALFAVVSLTLVASVYAHFQIAQSETYVGLLAPLDRLFDIAVALATVFMLVSLGLTVGRLLKLVWANTAEAISIALFLGTGVFGMAILGLGLLGLLRPLPVLLLSLLSLGLSHRQFAQLHGLIVEGLEEATSSANLKILTALFLCLVGFLFLRTLTPPHVFDEAIYHLPVTRQFVEQGRIFPNFNNSMGNQPFLIHMLYAFFLIIGSDIAAKIFSLSLTVATAFALFGFCARFLTRRVAIVAMFVFFAAGMVTEVAVTTRVDVSVAGMLFVTAYAMINYFESRSRGWFWASAILAGFSLSIKHSAVLWLLLLGGMYLIESVRKSREGFVTTLRYGVLYVMVAFAMVSPWYVKNYVWFGNPFYPFFTGEVATEGVDGVRYFNSEDELKLDRHFQIVRDKDPELVRAQFEVLANNATGRPTRHPMLPWEQYLRPHTYLMAEARHYPNYLFLVLPLSLFFVRQKWLVWLLVLSSCYFLMATWSSWIARYLLPVYPALSIVTAYIHVAISDWLKQKRPAFDKLPFLFVAVALVVVLTAGLRSLQESNSARFMVGAISRRDFMYGFSYYRPIAFINSELPANARVITIGAQMIYGIQRDYLTDETWYTTKWRRLLIRNDSFEQVNEDLKRQGVNYVLFSPDLFLFAAAMGLENGQVVPAGPRPLAAKALGIKYDPTNDLKQSFAEAKRLGSDFPVLRNLATFSYYRKSFLQPIYEDENGYRIFKVQ